MMRRASQLSILAILTLSTQAVAQEASTFPKGEKAPNVHHTGDVWLNHLSEADDAFDYNIALATFAAGAKLDWHIHPAGQQLLITQGVGYYQERGMEAQIVRQGEVIKCLPGVEHWHGATPTSDFAYLAITGNQPTQWLERVTDEEYSSLDAPDVNTNVEQELIDLSKQKWQWMSDKEVDRLTDLFHDQAVFVHMGGNMTKEHELSVIQSGGIHYKKADIHEVSVQFIGNTAVLLNRITLEAAVGGNEVTNPFTVTEVYLKQGDAWKLASMSFTRLLTP